MSEEVDNSQNIQDGVVIPDEDVPQPAATETIVTDDTVTETEPETGSDQPTASSRPKRNARKSTLYNNEDYELHATVKEEESNSSQSSKPPPKRARTEVGARKRKSVARLEEEVFAESLDVGAETEIPFDQPAGEARAPTGIDDDGPPILNLSTNYEDADELEENDEFVDQEDYFDDDGHPPDLEMHLPSKRRGRPRKPEDSQPTPKVSQSAPSLEKKEKKPSKNLNVRFSRAQAERVMSKTLADRQYNVKLFEDDIEVTENGDAFATVISGCLAYLLRKERIIELLTSAPELQEIRNSGWLLEKPPRLPPLVQHKACFAFYVDGSKFQNIKEISNDDLKPWSSSGEHFGDPVIKPNVRRHPVGRVQGRLQIVKGDPRIAELHLTEYSAWLPRLLRLRKKIFYLSRDGQIYGNVLILYDYTCSGEAPVVINLPHGNDYLRNAMLESASEPGLAMELEDPQSASPFEEEVVEGPRGGLFLRVKPSKLGWAHNKKLLLKYLINDPALLDNEHCLNRRTPFLPPLISHVGVFAYFVPSAFVANQIHHSGDGLSPWTVNPPGEAPSPRVRSTRKPLIQDEHGMFVIAKESNPAWQQQESPASLVETMSVLARCPRLRKRVIYVQRTNQIIMGNVCYIYEYVRDGPIPQPYIKPVTPGKLDGGVDYKPSDIPNASGVPEEDQYIDVEDIEVVEEEVIGHDPMMMVDDQIQMQDPHMHIQDDIIEVGQEDVLNNGFDEEFDDDPLTQQENPAPYYETARQLETGHIYLTVRHKRIASTFDAVLEWIANTNIVEDRGLLNFAKPGHPPIVRNSRAYVFFVAGTAIFPHDINRDDFSPWSHNGNAQNPTCYRTKVRKIGVICEEMGSQFQIKDVDYKTCPYHLVFLYSINPREPRLRKKIYYMMETESRLVVSHALIMYDYNSEGDLPRMHGGYLKRFTKRASKRQMQPLQMHDVDNDCSDISESEKESPFDLPCQIGDDGCTYLQLIDMDFWNDRNRQLHYLVNKPELAQQLGCLNSRVPQMPPLITTKGAFVFFVDGHEIDARNLTSDALVPWSENNSTNPHGITKRPKSAKHPLALNRDHMLRVWKTPNSQRPEHVEFQLHVYTATLPRCPRLRKKVTYVLKNGHQVGHAMIIYSYTEPGDPPAPLNMTHYGTQDYSLQRLPLQIREECLRLLNRMTPAEVSKEIMDKYGVQVNSKLLYYVRRREMMTVSNMRDQITEAYDVKNDLIQDQNQSDYWQEDPNVPGPSNPSGGRKTRKQLMMDDKEMQVAHTEVIEHEPIQHPEARYPPRHPQAIGSVRGNQRNDTIWRIAKTSFGSSNDNETFDQIFKMLFDKNETRLLQIVNTTFGVEILPDEEIMIGNEGEIVEEIVEEEVVQEGDVDPDEIIDVQNDDNHVVEEEKVYLDPKDLNNVMEEAIVEEEVNDHLLEEALVDGVIVEEEVDPSIHHL